MIFMVYNQLAIETVDGEAKKQNSTSIYLMKIDTASRYKLRGKMENQYDALGALWWERKRTKSSRCLPKHDKCST